MSTKNKPNRRQFLKSMATGTVATGTLLAPSTSISSSTSNSTKADSLFNAENFIVHGTNPLRIETRRSVIGMGVITPTDRFFVRNNLPLPTSSIVSQPDQWAVTVNGVKQPIVISVGELKALGLETVGTVIQCSGNGRAFFTHGPAGSNWSVGAAGCAIWTGIRLKTLIDHCGGVEAGAHFLTACGGEIIPEDMDRNSLVVERSIPIAKALDDTFLAWEMNGEPIPLLHGGPLRLIVPGYFGCNNIKYVKTISFDSKQSEAKIQNNGYRFRPIGTSSSSHYPSMWRMPVKSWLNGPGADNIPTLAGEVNLYGVALSGERGVERVEISLDMGETWQLAKLEPMDLGPNAWRVFSYKVSLPPGRHTIVSRATDLKGDVQPKERLENERGYAHNGWLDAALTVTTVLPEQKAQTAGQVTAAKPVLPARQTISTPEQAQAGKQLYQQAQPPCGSCHTLADAASKGLIGPNLDSLKPDVETVINAVTGGVGAMPSYSDSMTQEQISKIANYIVKTTQ